jgi:serine/threonine protein kinase
MQIIDGMLFLVAQRVVHRDLATRNILVMPNKGTDDKSRVTLKICDFGLSRHKNKMNACGDVYYRPASDSGVLLKCCSALITHFFFRRPSYLVGARSINGLEIL